MSCELCEKAHDEGRVYYYRWKNANIGVIGCTEHVKEIMGILHKRTAKVEKK